MTKCNSDCKCEFNEEKTIPEALAKIFENYPTRSREYAIPLLQDVQGHYGYLSEENMTFVAKHLNMPTSKVYGVATFYNQFRLLPLGKNVIKVCRGTACHVKGSSEILEVLQTELEIQPGETTSDGLFTLETVACIGACSIAPVIVINDEFFGRLTPKEARSLLKNYD
jgi:NADH-quinone oxidoreductase subunit E